MLTSALLAAGPAAPSADAPDDRLRERDDAVWQRALIRLERRAVIMAGARRRAARVAERAALARRAQRGDSLARVQLAAFRMKRPARDVDGAWPASPRGIAAEAFATQQVAASVPLNVRVNDPVPDAAGAGQSETSIAAHGDHVVVAWNDGQGFTTGGDTQGFAWSADGGQTFNDGGDILHPPAFPTWQWTSDPVLAVNEATGEFWYCGLAEPDAGTNAIAVARGRFTADVFAFDSVFLVRHVANTAAFLDKQWFAVDSATGRLFVTHTTFAASNQIDACRSVDGGRTWSAPTKLSSAGDNGFVQGSRIATGPDGAVHAVWFAADQVVDPDNVRYRRSPDGGVTWLPETTPITFIANITSGAPGFNRERGIAFPSLAVDRSHGLHRGRVHVAWAESFDFWNDLFPSTTTSPARVEVENNGTAATGTPFTPGQVLRGTLTTTSNASDRDFYSCALSAGDHLYVLADSTRSTSGTSNSAAFTLRLYAPDGVQMLAYAGDLDSSSVTSARWVFTAPVSGTYHLRMAAISRRTAGYRLRTMLAARGSERGRDHRDAFAAWTADGVHWSAPVRLCDDGVGFDAYLPEIGVGADGLPYAWWYDHRDDLYGSRTHVHATRSGDGGVTWQANARVSSAISDFSAAASNIAPNHGDYNHLAASATRMHLVWSDARGVSVDPWSAALATTTRVTSAPPDTALAPGASVALGWTVRNDNPRFAGDYSIVVSDARGWLAAGSTPVTLAAEGQTLSLTQVAVPDSAAAGGDLVCLQVTNSAGVRVASDCVLVTVDAGALGVGASTSGLQLARPSPNPARGSTWLGWTLPRAGRMSLSVYDLTGARVRELVSGEQSAGPGRVRWDGRDARGTPVRAGAYFVRLEAAGEVRRMRLALLR